MNIHEFTNNVFALIRGVFCRVRLNSCGKLLRCEKGVRILKINGKINLGNKVFLHRGVKLSASGSEGVAEINIGDGSYIGDRTEIHSGSGVNIGKGVLIAWNCNIIDRDYHKFESEKERVSPVNIGDHVWIGLGSTILKGVTIGSGAVVAAGSVVTHDVPERALVAGNPAKVIRENVSWKE